MPITRSSLVIALVAPALACGCFALFSLDDYGPNPGGSTEDASADASTDAIDAATDGKLAPRVVFVTSDRFLGSMGGLAGADNRCNALAVDAGLGGSFVAWLGADDASAASRIPQPNREMVLVNGDLVAVSLDALGNEGPRARILLTEKRLTLATAACDGDHVWTNATANGGLPDAGLDCNGWGSVTSGGGAGKLGGARDEWTTGCSARACDSMARLYCVQK